MLLSRGKGFFMPSPRAFGRISLLVSLVFGLASLLMPRPALAQYSVLNLGTLSGGSASYGNAINDSTYVQVTGSSDYGGGPQVAFSYTLGPGMTYSATPGGPGNSSVGNGINNAAYIAGTEDLGGPTQSYQNFGGSPSYIATVGSPNNVANDINNAKYIVGTDDFGGGTTVAYVNYGGSVTVIPSLNFTKDNTAEAISNTNLVTGTSGTGMGTTHAYLYSYGAGSSIDLGSLAGPAGNSYGYAVNDVKQVAGYSEVVPGGPVHAFLYTSGMMDLGTLTGPNSYAYGINNAGDVVGAADVATGGTHAFLYTGGSMVDLNTLISPTSGWELLTANDINNIGYITGTGLFFGKIRAYVLLPSPEPSSMVSLLCGSLFIGGLILRRRLHKPDPTV